MSGAKQSGKVLTAAHYDKFQWTTGSTCSKPALVTGKRRSYSLSQRHEGRYELIDHGVKALKCPQQVCGSGRIHIRDHADLQPRLCTLLWLPLLLFLLGLLQPALPADTFASFAPRHRRKPEARASRKDATAITGEQLGKLTSMRYSPSTASSNAPSPARSVLLALALLTANLYSVDELFAQESSPGAATPRLSPRVSEKAPQLPSKMQCEAEQTVGLHDYEGAPESYEPSTFFESKFELRINSVLTRHLAKRSEGAEGSEVRAEATPDLFLTMRPSKLSRNSEQSRKRPIELRCRQIQGQSGELGYSCSNTPPSEFLLINPGNLRFTRTSIGGWTFSDTQTDTQADTQKDTDEDDQTGANLGDDSLFVEYGTCESPGRK